jgi:hypothetical protein
MLFAVVFIEKNAKKKKKNGTLLKVFPLISPQQEHLRTKFQLILEAIVQGYNFHFCPFLVIGHVTIVPIFHWMDPVRYNHPYVVFWVQPDEQMTLTWTLKALPSYIVCTISNFSAIL